jgi:phage terminase large subunit-like protein
MQKPRPKGGRLFEDSVRYAPPAMLIHRRVVIAADVAATKKNSADYTAIVIAAFFVAQWKSPEGLMLQLPFADVLRVYRMRVEIPDTVRILQQLANDWPGSPIVVESQGGQGLGVVQTLRRVAPDHLPLHAAPRTVDKFTAAQPVRAANNQGRWRIPLRHDPEHDSSGLEKLLRELDVWDEGNWIAPYMGELKKFTGTDDREDDQVDASAHCWDYGSLIAGISGGGGVRGKRKGASDAGF